MKNESNEKNKEMIPSREFKKTYLHVVLILFLMVEVGFSIQPFSQAIHAYELISRLSTAEENLREREGHEHEEMLDLLAAVSARDLQKSMQFVGARDYYGEHLFDPIDSWLMGVNWEVQEGEFFEALAPGESYQNFVYNIASYLKHTSPEFQKRVYATLLPIFLIIMTVSAEGLLVGLQVSEKRNKRKRKSKNKESNKNYDDDVSRLVDDPKQDQGTGFVSYEDREVPSTVKIEKKD